MQTFNYNISNKNINNIIQFDKFMDKENLLIQVFTSKSEDQLKPILVELSNKLPNAAIIGCSTFSQIIDENIYSTDTIISISIFEKSTLNISFSDNTDAYENGKDLSYNLITSNTKLLILFSSRSSDNEDFLRGINSISNDVIICGGVASKNEATPFIIFNNQILKNSTVGVSINSNDLIVKNDYRFNWSSIGIEHKVTKVNNNKILEISNLKTLEFYKKYLGKDYEKSFENHNTFFPLLVKINNEFKAIKVLKIEQDGSFLIDKKLKINDKVKFGFGNKDKLLKEPIISEYTDYSNMESFFIFSSEDRIKFLTTSANKENIAYSNITNTSGMFCSYQFFHNQKTKLLSHCFTVISLSENINHNNKKSNNKLIHNNCSDEINFKTLTHLMEQSSYDYKEQSVNLEVEKFNSQMLLTSQKIFLRHAVHETNTPISVIMSNVELYEMQYGKNQYLTNIEVALKNIFNIYDDLSYLVKKDKVEYPKKDMDIIDFIRARIEFFTTSALQIGSKFVFSTNAQSLIYKFNETKLQRIIDNNLTNAIKYTNDNSNIYVNIFLDENKFIIDISSSSLYIQSPIRVFKEYYREESSKQGFGLGLSLVKKICDEENIKIILDSNEYFTSFKYLFTLEKK